MGWGPALTRGGGNIRVLLAPYLATSRELSGAAKASLRLGLGHPLYAPRACSLLPPPSVRLSLATEAIAYLITISSSSIDSLVTHARLACSLPYTQAILPHIKYVTALGRVTCHILLYSADSDFSSLTTSALATPCIHINPQRPLPSSSSSPQLSIFVQQQSTSFSSEAFIRARHKQTLQQQ